MIWEKVVFFGPKKHWGEWRGVRSGAVSLFHWLLFKEGISLGRCLLEGLCVFEIPKTRSLPMVLFQEARVHTV